jgi:hypothetical protein
MTTIFLSASVPLPDRHPQFAATADIVAIRESIKALVGEAMSKSFIVYGGHPAITPLIALLLRGRSSEARRHIILYQSEFFSDQFADENGRFVDLRLVPSVRKSKPRSLKLLRNRMISDHSFDVGVFIGGMDGVLEEFELFRRLHPAARVWPIASTGGAAQILFDSIGRPRPELFLDQITYPTLFRQLFRELG